MNPLNSTKTVGGKNWNNLLEHKENMINLVPGVH